MHNPTRKRADLQSLSLRKFRQKVNPSSLGKTAANVRLVTKNWLDASSLKFYSFGIRTLIRTSRNPIRDTQNSSHAARNNQPPNPTLQVRPSAHLCLNPRFPDGGQITH